MDERPRLPPHLEKFVRDSLAAGQFRSEADVIRSAIHLLESQSRSRDALHAWLKQELDRGLSSRPTGRITPAFWDGHRDRVRVAGPDD